MGKGRSMKANNIYTRCRQAAAEYDDRLKTRERASEELGCSVSMLADYELDIRAPQPEMILKMADRYGAPELVRYYCSSVCPLGRNNQVLPEFSDFDRVAIMLVSALKDSEYISDVILEIAADGEISDKEVRKLDMVRQAMNNISKAADSLKLFVAKHEASQNLNGKKNEK